MMMNGDENRRYLVAPFLITYVKFIISYNHKSLCNLIKKEQKNQSKM